MTSLKDRIVEIYVTCFGLGYAPVASGTFGTLGGVAVAALVGWTWPEYYLPLLIVLTTVMSLLGALCGGWAERRYGRKDPGQFVLDEVVGYMVAVMWWDFPGWKHLIAGFFLFRLFDIVKPYPARRLEKLKGGWGIVVDDLVAGAYALLAVAGIRMLFPTLFS
ncbi:MAG: phosphatidylglycerophosphatase A [Planctomycetes bacterium]|nr:phosphatidylglycerophosphatase A [Planctomycetota bacterium]